MTGGSSVADGEGFGLRFFTIFTPSKHLLRLDWSCAPELGASFSFFAGGSEPGGEAWLEETNEGDPAGRV
jgi:hypothetical protein